MGDLSRILHRAISGQDRSFCARAWEHRETCWFWKAWVRVFGPQHCRSSYEWYSQAKGD